MNIGQRIKLQFYKNRYKNMGINRRYAEKLSYYLELDDSQLSYDEKVKIIKGLNQDEKIRCLNNNKIILDSNSRREILQDMEPLELLKAVNLTDEEKDIIVKKISSEEQLLTYLAELDNNEKIDILKRTKYEIAIDILRNKTIEIEDNDRKKIINNLDENEKIETVLDEEENLYFRIELMSSLKDEKKLELLNQMENSSTALTYSQKAQIISTMDGENKIQALKTYKIDPKSQISLFKDLSEENIIEILNETGYSSEHLDFLINNISDKAKLTIQLDKSNRIKQSLMASLSTSYDKEKIDFFDLNSIAESMEETLNKSRYLDDKILNQLEVISTLSDKYEPLKMDYIDVLMKKISKEKQSPYNDSIVGAIIELSANLTDDNKREYAKKINEILDKEEINHSINKEMRSKLLPQSIKKFIEIAYPDEANEKIQLLETLERNNPNIEKNIDLGFLKDEYFNFFGAEKTELITTSYSLQEKMVSLEDNEKNMLFKVFPVIQDNKEWNYYLNTLLDILHDGQFSKLCAQLSENQEEVDYEKMFNIIINDSENLFDIQTIEDINNYEEIRKNICDKIIKEDNDIPTRFNEMTSLERKKFAYLERIYGHDTKVAQRILETYGPQIDEINNKELKNYVKSIELILGEEDESKIDRLCNVKGIDKEIIDTISVEKALQEEYGKLFDKSLYRVQDSSEKYKGNEFGKNVLDVYDAGSDFKMVIHAVDAVDNRGAERLIRQNYYEYWNRKDFNGQMSCSYITNKQLKRANDYSITFGFVDMPESLLLMGPEDIGSQTTNTIVTSNVNKFLSPDELSNNTLNDYNSGWNEMAYSPYKFIVNDDGKVIKQKKQPDYMVVYKKNRSNN